MKISVVIITFNEQDRLEAALNSVEGIAAEIIIVDSYSTDHTLKIAKDYTDRIFLRKWTNFSDQKNFANNKASNPWILSLDADERISPDLKQEIMQIQQNEPDCAGFSMPRQVYYLGRWIKHSGWYPDRKIRLFRKDLAHWEGEFVHEKLVIDGEVKRLKGPLYHFTYRNIRDHLDRINKFSDLGAKKLYASDRKSRWYHYALLPFFRFVKSYFLKAGFLDGFPGIVIAALHGYAIFIRYAKLKEIWKKGEKIEPFPN